MQRNLKESISINIRVKFDQEAKNVLLDLALFSVDTKTFNQLKKLLVEPLPITDKLRRLLATKAPWGNK